MGLKNQITQLLRRFISDETGQSTTEYILILAVVVMIALKFKSTFSGRLNKITEDLGTKIDGAMQDQ